MREIEIEIECMHGVGPVSYTHLDVYKRQRVRHTYAYLYKIVHLSTLRSKVQVFLI